MHQTAARRQGVARRQELNKKKCGFVFACQLIFPSAAFRNSQLCCLQVFVHILTWLVIAFNRTFKIVGTVDAKITSTLCYRAIVSVCLQHITTWSRPIVRQVTQDRKKEEI